ncbi:MAG: zf-HC2 domain-containing protein [Planctomycetales bacterium]|nr:zf-HC2 domain-containing protein [Planctomycetales bacterium]MCA9171648.1 zf-HC2 domain-containing protein [Planctomycetales bacterium]
MTGSTNPITSNDQELLVAYLDGELSPTESAAVEQRLSTDDEFRKLLRGLQEAWDLLDDLPHPTVGDGFTKTTVEMVAVRLSEDTDRAVVKAQQRGRWRVIATILATAAGLIAGFLVMRHQQQADDRALLTDLPVIERVDQYTQVDDIQFLESLANSELFVDNFEVEVSDDER